MAWAAATTTGTARVESLARQHTIHRFDLLGHGARAATQRLPTLQQMAHDVAAGHRRPGLERPLLVGHSMGALVVMKYLQDHGEAHIAGVCLIDQSPCITNRRAIGSSACSAR